ncbi:MAG: hypothetical protein IKH92_03650 [Clostridiales bacterium]|nr:hypothetical protein [Clostridiales bacterium]
MPHRPGKRRRYVHRRPLRPGHPRTRVRSRQRVRILLPYRDRNRRIRRVSDPLRHVLPRQKHPFRHVLRHRARRRSLRARSRGRYRRDRLRRVLRSHDLHDRNHVRCHVRHRGSYPCHVRDRSRGRGLLHRVHPDRLRGTQLRSAEE